jgi:peptidoglycan/xylan/chitin deacetylase (PgdA/CDA1 family)
MVISRRSFASGALSVVIGSGAGMAAAPARARPGFRWPGGARAAVSLTYDDGLDSQIAYAARALDAAGLKGTFFLTRENMEGRAADWQAVAKRGHEMGNHSVTHPCDLRRCKSAAFRQDEIEPMEAFLDQTFGPDRFRSYAYPCGWVGMGEGSLRQRIARYQAALKGEVEAARTVSGLSNDPLRVAADPFMLHAFEPTYAADDPKLAFRYMRGAMASGGWAILVFHEVLPARAGEGDTSVAAHDAILAWLAKAPVWCAPLGEVFQYCVIEADRPAVARGQPRIAARA